MKKLEGRSLICVVLILAITAGLLLFIGRYVVFGKEWSGQYWNEHIYHDGILTSGSIRDRNGNVLLVYDNDGAHYASDVWDRRAVSTVVGDINNSISTGANVVFKKRLYGYNLLTGTNGIFGRKSGKVVLSIDSKIMRTAYDALGNYSGFVGVYNWKTGEILCLVSTPTVDPQDSNAAQNAASGAYINKILSSKYAPGSVFKVVTSCACIECKDDIDKWTYKCTGSTEINGEKVTCTHAHGTVDFYGALADSCNCAYAHLTLELGPELMEKYTKKMGLYDSYNVSGIETVPGNFDFDTDDINLAWAGIGQYHDEANPMSIMVMMGAIAGDGKAAEPVLIKGENTGNVSLISEETAKELQNMLHNNVEANYGVNNFPGLDISAKSGTAETQSGTRPNAWFAGYSGDYAFVVCVEQGGFGADTAAPIANKVLQKINETYKSDK